MSELSLFVRDALLKGHTRSEVRAVLTEAKWPPDEVEHAIGQFAEVPFDVPVPYRKQSGSAREAFLYLVTFTTLYISAIAIGSLLFGLIEHYIKDPLADRYYSYADTSGLPYSVAAIVVAFPIYLLLTRMHLRSYLREPERRTSPVRRWLTYLTLFVAANVVIGTLITLIGGVLTGDLASRFVLETATVLVLALTVLLYYLWEIRFAEREAKP